MKNSKRLKGNCRKRAFLKSQKQVVLFSPARRAEHKEEIEFEEKKGSSQYGSMKNQKENYFENAKLIMDSINRDVFLNSNKIFENLIKSFSLTKQNLGAEFIRRITGYDEKYLERNIRMPEFQKELKKRIDEKFEDLKKQNLLDSEDRITDFGYDLATFNLVIEELDNLRNLEEGVLKSKIKSFEGEKQDFKDFKNGHYKDIDIRRSVRTALRRIHKNILEQDLKEAIRKDKRGVNIVYAVDASGSMKGEKLEQAKKAGIALIYKAIKDRNKVGLIVFQEKIVNEIQLTDKFEVLMKELVKIRARQQTNIEQTIIKSIEMFSKIKSSKNLIIITDVIPTLAEKGQDPVEKTLKAASIAASQKISISIVGIKLEKPALELAKRIVEMTSGKLYLVLNAKELDRTMLEEYSRIQA
ncbi:MAG: vWA domain-containing protein [Candidatus Woesearchaeota archaeon]